MRTCTRCAAGEWHPDVRTCPFRDCQFRPEVLAAATDVVIASNTQFDRPRGLIAAVN